jgi:hypothetical protein
MSDPFDASARIEISRTEYAERHGDWVVDAVVWIPKGIRCPGIRYWLDVSRTHCGLEACEAVNSKWMYAEARDFERFGGPRRTAIRMMMAQLDHVTKYR